MSEVLEWGSGEGGGGKGGGGSPIDSHPSPPLVPIDAKNNNQLIDSASHSAGDSNNPTNGSPENLVKTTGPTSVPLSVDKTPGAGPGPEIPPSLCLQGIMGRRSGSPSSSNPQSDPEEDFEGDVQSPGGGSTDQESHSSSLESVPSVYNKNFGPEDEDCAEEELGSSTSCSLDSFEISSPFGTMEAKEKFSAPGDIVMETIISGPDPQGTMSSVPELDEETPVKEQTDSLLLGMDVGTSDPTESTVPEDLVLSATSFELPIFRVEGNPPVTSESADQEEGEEELVGGKSGEGVQREAPSSQTQSLPPATPTQSHDEPSRGSGLEEREGNEGWGIEATEKTLDDSTKYGSVQPSTSAGTWSSNRASSVRQSIHEELSRLDTALPHLDFDKLEAQLACAAEEREMKNRKLMSEEVRRRLAMDTDDTPYPPIPSTRPSKSNLGTRLRSGLNMQICYMNDTSLPSDEEGEESSSSDDEISSVPKSKSTPNLYRKKKQANGAQVNSMGRSASSVCDSSKKASELRKAVEQMEASQITDLEKKQARLEEEARVMLEKAKQAAHMQMEVERQAKSAKSPLEDIIGVELNRCKRMTRSQLSRMNTTQLQIILNDLLNKVEKQNGELVQLLIDKDNLHMEQDSMLVDVEDLLQHQRDAANSLPGFLVNAPPESKFSRFRIFKK